MAAGTDIPHPVSVLEGVNCKSTAVVEPLPMSTMNGTAQTNNDHEASGSRPPKPGGPGHRRSASSSQWSSASQQRRARDLERERRDGPEQDEPVRDEAAALDPLYMPFLRSGGGEDIGTRPRMEDAHMRIDDLIADGQLVTGDSTGAFYGVFDGHGGFDAAIFVRDNLLNNILADGAFPSDMGNALRNAFLQTDLDLVDEDHGSGTTAIAATVFGRSLVVANAGDCRAVLSKRGRAVEMSADHKPESPSEKIRIYAAGGHVTDGYLNGYLNVARALGDWGLSNMKVVGHDGPHGPLVGKPDVMHADLTDEDEFLIIGCDGIWDVFSSQNAIDFARKKLQEHNDPERCSNELIAEALRRHTSDNLTVVTVCFRPDPPPRPPKWTPRFRRTVSLDVVTDLQLCIDDALVERNGLQTSNAMFSMNNVEAASIPVSNGNGRA